MWKCLCAVLAADLRIMQGVVSHTKGALMLFANQKLRSIALAAILICASSRTAEVTPGEVNVPDWALGVLSFRQLGTSLEKTGAYANSLLPNSAELAKQIIMTQVFRLPMNAGIKNGAALIL